MSRVDEPVPGSVEDPEHPRRGTPAGNRESSGGSRVSEQVGRFALLGFLGLMILAFSIALPSTFPTFGNFAAIATSEELLLLLAIAVTVPLRTGVFDISVASTMVLSAVVVTKITDAHVPLVPAILIGTLIGAGVGCVNAFLVVGLGVNAFITTLGTGTVLNGISYALTNGVVISVSPSAPLLTFARLNVVGRLPIGVIYGLVGATILWYFYEYTPFGRQLLFVGASPDVARLAGIRVGRVSASAFVIAGLIAGFAGVLFAGSLGAVDSSVAAQYLLPPYAAAFLSTTAIQIGRFNIIGTVIGLYLLAVGITGLELFGVSPWVGDAFNGGALIVAVAVARRAALTRGHRPRTRPLLPPVGMWLLSKVRTRSGQGETSEHRGG